MKTIATIGILVIAQFCGCTNTSENENKKVENSSLITENVNKSDQIFENERFRNVRVSRQDDSIRVTGEARVFEANFLYEVFHNTQKVKDSFITASIGAPEWGSFKFSVKLPETQPGDSVFVRIYESSAKDGSPLGILHMRVNE